MKKLHVYGLAALTALMALAGCKHGGAGTCGDADSLCYRQHSDTLSCDIVLRVAPKDIQPQVNRWISDQLWGEYTGPTDDLQTLIDAYGKGICDSLREAYRWFPVEDLAYSATMQTLYETPHAVTYLLNSYVYLGGAHPSSMSEGATFDKTDGSLLGWDMVRPECQAELKNLLKQGIMDYFESDDEAFVLDMLLEVDSFDGLPLPQSNPYLTETGVAFLYQQYEIACYAAGMPSGIIAYDQIEPLLTDRAKVLLPNCHE